MGFIDQMRAEVHAVESIARVLREQSVKIAARTYRLWPQVSTALENWTVAALEK